MCNLTDTVMILFIIITPIAIAGAPGAVVRGRGEGEQDARLRSAVPDHLAVERQQARPLRSHAPQRGEIPLHYRQRDIILHTTGLNICTKLKVFILFFSSNKDGYFLLFSQKGLHHL